MAQIKNGAQMSQIIYNSNCCVRGFIQNNNINVFFFIHCVLNFYRTDGLNAISWGTTGSNFKILVCYEIKLIRKNGWIDSH